LNRFMEDESVPAACLTFVKKVVPYILVPALALRGYATLSLHGATWLAQAELYGAWALQTIAQGVYRLKDAAFNEPETSTDVLYNAEVTDAFATMLPQWEHHHVLWVVMWLWFTWVAVQRSFYVHTCQLGAAFSIFVGGITVMFDLHPATALTLQAWASVIAAIPANIAMRHNSGSFDLGLLFVEVVWDTSEAWVSLCSIACALILKADPLRFVLAVHAAVLLSKACESQRQGHEVDGFYPYVGVTRLEDLEDVVFTARSLLVLCVLTGVLKMLSPYWPIVGDLLPGVTIDDLLPGFVVHSVFGYSLGQFCLLWLQWFFLAMLFDIVAVAYRFSLQTGSDPNRKKRRAK